MIKTNSMKKIAYISLLTIFSYSCIDVKFEEAQPIETNSLKSFPKELRGQFTLEGVEPNDIEIITIGENYFTEIDLIKSDSTTKKKKNIYLSDSLVLKKLEENYLLNFKNEEYWSVYLINQIDNNSFSVKWIDGDNEEIINKLKLMTPTKEIVDDDGKISSYLINPTKANLKKILKQDYFFTELYKLKKVQE